MINLWPAAGSHRPAMQRISLVVLAVLLFLAAWFPRPGLAGDPPDIRLGGSIRLRAEGMDNALDLDDSARDSYGFYRMKYSFWADGRPRDGLRVYLRLGNEYRWGVYAGSVRGGDAYDMASVRDPESRVSLDNGFVEIGLTDGLCFSFGRMDMIYGEGFLLFDGTPADGGASLYFDTAMLTWRRGAARVDLFNAKIQDEGFGTPVKDEDLYGLYLRRKSADLYVLSRNKRGTTHSFSGVVHPRQSTTAMGARYAHVPRSGVHLVGEGAAQAGRYRLVDADGPKSQDVDRRAFGGYLRGGWTMAARPGIGFELGGTALSGDDPSTRENEGWDGFHSEWSLFSELYIYTVYDNTTRVRGESDGRVILDDEGSWTNLAAAWAEVRLLAGGQYSAAARMTYLGAIEKTGIGPGRERGLLLMAKMEAVPASGLALQILGERFVPGDYYWTDADVAWYGRAQITASF